VGPEKQPPGQTWMTAEQEQLTEIYGFVSLAVVSLVGALFLSRFLKAAKDMFTASHEVSLQGSITELVKVLAF